MAGEISKERKADLIAYESKMHTALSELEHHMKPETKQKIRDALSIGLSELEAQGVYGYWTMSSGEDLNGK